VAASACARREAEPAPAAVPAAVPAPAPAPAVPLRALADTLIRLGLEDQARREELPRAVAANDTAFVLGLMRADSARTTRLRTIVRAHGWPVRTLVGDSAAKAAWLILQHSPVLEFQREVLPLLEAAAERGDVERSEVALLTDRVRVRSGQPQLYGSSFQMVNGRLQADPIEDPARLDERRAAVGLPPMAEYVRGLSEAYHVPVVWPPVP
jgi:hypothetical protein